MRRLNASTIVVFLFSAGALAGCVGGPEGPEPAPPRAQASLSERVLEVLAEVPPLQGYDREAALTWWEDFVHDYAGRQWGSPKNAEAAAYLQAELAEAGYEAETIMVKGNLAPIVGGSVPVQGDFRVVRGVKPGVGNASHRIALISHYDIIHVGGATVQGAYDDGAGVAVEMEICRLLAKVPTNKTIECIFFDGEEMGLSGSQGFIQYYSQGPREYVYDQAFGYDMTGLNWPGHPNWKLYALMGLTQHERLTEEMQLGHEVFLKTALYDFLAEPLGVTEKGVEVKLRNHRNSDEQRFERALGVPVVRFAGGYNPNWYPMYHRPGDTIEYVYNFACGNCTASDPVNGLSRGREAFGKGMEMVTAVSYYTILAYDKFDSYQIIA